MRSLYRCLVIEVASGRTTRKCVYALDAEDALIKLVGTPKQGGFTPFYALYGEYKGEKYITAHYSGKDFYVYQEVVPLPNTPTLTFDHLIGKIKDLQT